MPAVLPENVLLRNSQAAPVDAAALVGAIAREGAVFHKAGASDSAAHEGGAIASERAPLRTVSGHGLQSRRHNRVRYPGRCCQ